ncbi:MAG: hypothetical protein B6241_03105 [Spirochaetaceae bacterium 4572_59]|nr:MAG: hypothetical protein B6241_03105 [Spirochaetaceae bacterium 4572_59]
MILSTILCRNYCYFCGSSLQGDRAFCESCSEIIRSFSESTISCPHCSFPLFADERICAYCPVLPENIETLLSLSCFKGVAKECLYLYKSGKLKNLRYFYAAWLHSRFQKSDLYRDALIVPVPPRKGKMRNKGWDQVMLISQTLHKRYGYQILYALKRNDSVQQKFLNLEERNHHLQNSITLRRGMRFKPPPERPLILLDDVFTSGATLSACAGVLKSSYSNPLEGAVLCTVL